MKKLSIEFLNENVEYAIINNRADNLRLIAHQSGNTIRFGVYTFYHSDNDYRFIINTQDVSPHHIINIKVNPNHRMNCDLLVHAIHSIWGFFNSWAYRNHTYHISKRAELLNEKQKLNDKLKSVNNCLSQNHVHVPLPF